MSLAADNASLAEVVAVQVPRLAQLRPRRVVLQLGQRELRDGFDESYFHAHLVEVLDRIAASAPTASIQVIGIPSGAGPAHQRDLFNAAARVTADLRGASWRDGEIADPTGS